VRLVFVNRARKFVGLVALLFFALPFGLSVTGCGHKAAPIVFCNPGDTGPIVGQVATIVLSPILSTTGESLNFGQIGVQLSATAEDCKGNAIALKSVTYGSTSSFGENTSGAPIIADINPTNGQVCGGTWNRNSSGGVPNFTTCTPPPAITPRVGPVSLTPPTAATSTAGSATALVLTQPTDFVSGTLSLAVGAGTPQPLTIAADTSLTTLAALINSTYSAQGITAAVNPTNTALLTISGPAGSSDTLVTTGTTLVDTANTFLAFVTAEADGATSNAIPIFVHPVVSAVALATNPATINCSTNPDSTCCPNDTIGTPVSAPPYPTATSTCLSQNTVGQLSAQVFSGTQNITCQVGHLTFAAQTPSIVSIDENGAATAGQPGSTIITATVANSAAATDAGFFSTCPPTSIVLSAPGKTNPVSVAINTAQPLTTTVRDKNNNIITGLTLEFNSTTPQTIQTTIGAVTPIFPGSADITAVCNPAICNPSPFSQLGLYGNGVPLTSNPLTINATGTSSTVLYMGSTSSQYVAFRDFTTNQPSALIKLPYVPTSMVMNQAGTEIYFGSLQGLMSISTATNTVTGAVQTIPGNVLSVSPDGTMVVVTDTIRQTISLVTASTSAVSTSYGGVGTSAAWSPDSQTVYVTTTTPTVLTHSTFTDWQTNTTTTNNGEIYSDVAVTVPHVGAYFAGLETTDGRSYCPASTITGTGNPAIINNQFIPLVDDDSATTDQIAATTDGNHILGAHAISGGTSTLSDLDIKLPADVACPIPPASQPATGYFTSTHTTQNLSGINAATISGVVPSSNSAAAFVTYTPPSANPTTNALLPLYLPPASGQGTLQNLTLGNGATAEAAPLAGVFSTDNFTFYVGTGSSDPTDTTSADNDVHLITMTYPTGGAPTATEVTGSILSPQLPLATGSGLAPVNLIAQHPKLTTN
jgi:trimeric autotransporter adhesin